MTFTTTTWNTTSVARIKADYVVVHRKPGGTRRAIDANMVLTQMNETAGTRRTILGVTDPATCEVIAAPDIDGFEGLVSIHRWRSRLVNIALNTMNDVDA
ncbi:hypothetical protein KL953_17625 [Mycolicibacterium goodii]|uniref:hypothetical protein n=1 Tax=Mycolicibacterium goodii TaxID=134601 RepID=UPI001BDC94A5|nr:hypothetical protein [Mycolicibacterium goodii]MBU8810705.1 hypothetical protein [Mycolicibacterium goodii]